MSIYTAGILTNLVISDVRTDRCTVSVDCDTAGEIIYLSVRTSGPYDRVTDDVTIKDPGEAGATYKATQTSVVGTNTFTDVVIIPGQPFYVGAVTDANGSISVFNGPAPGWSSVRAGVQTGIDEYKIVRQVADNQGAYDGCRFNGTVFVPGLDAEYVGARTDPAGENLCNYSRDLTNAVWSANSVTVDGVTQRVTASAGGQTATFMQMLAVGAGDYCGSVYLLGSGGIEISVDGGSTWASVTVTGEYQLFSATANTANPSIGVRFLNLGDWVEFLHPQIEVGTVPTARMFSDGGTTGLRGDNHFRALHSDLGLSAPLTDEWTIRYQFYLHNGQGENASNATYFSASNTSNAVNERLVVGKGFNDSNLLVYLRYGGFPSGGTIYANVPEVSNGGLLDVTMRMDQTEGFSVWVNDLAKQTQGDRAGVTHTMGFFALGSQQYSNKISHPHVIHRAIEIIPEALPDSVIEAW